MSVTLHPVNSFVADVKFMLSDPQLQLNYPVKKTNKTMRHFFLFLTGLILAACSSDSDVMAETQTVQGGNTLVVFYSYTGNCRKIVNELTSQITADVVEIQPAEKGLSYEANNYALGTKLLNAINADPDNAQSYPAIDPVDVQLSKYKNVIIVTPLWWSQMAAIMQTYLFNAGPQMAGKNIGLIVSSASSGISGVVKDCKRLVPDGNYFSEPLWIRSSQVKNAASLISGWLQKINLNIDDEEDENMKIKVSDGTNTIVYELNTTSAAKSLYNMLPMEVEVQNYSNNEKIFYPATDISYAADCIEGDCPAGTLALFSPWGNVVMFYGPASRYSGLYILGKAISGTDHIKNLSGTITVEPLDNSTGIRAYVKPSLNPAEYTLSGTIAQKGYKGIVVSDGKKILR